MKKKYMGRFFIVLIKKKKRNSLLLILFQVNEVSIFFQNDENFWNQFAASCTLHQPKESYMLIKD